MPNNRIPNQINRVNFAWNEQQAIEARLERAMQQMQAQRENLWNHEVARRAAAPAPRHPLPYEMLAAAKPKFKIHWGGADVDPQIYNRPRSDWCGHTNKDRDTKEMDEMAYSIENHIPIIGICRGAQLLNVVNGGVLVQHIDNHAIAGQHPCIIDDGTNPAFECGVSSTHHQMMVPHKDGIIIGKSTEGTTGMHWDMPNQPYKFKYVTEVVWYPKTLSLCIQPHPEWMNQDSKFVRWINSFIKHNMGLDPIDFKEQENRYNNW